MPGVPGVTCALRHCCGSTCCEKCATGWPCTNAEAGTAVIACGARKFTYVLLMLVILVMFVTFTVLFTLTLFTTMLRFTRS